MRILVVILMMLSSSFIIYCQNVSVKTNVLYDALLTPTLGAEVGISRKSSLDLMVAFAPFNYGGDKTYKHILVQPEYRWWFCEAFAGSFIGIHGHWGAFNEGGYKLPFNLVQSLENSRYQGQLAGAGVSYGYQWLLGKHWGLELEIGVGYAYIWYKSYECGNCGNEKGNHHKNYFGPTKAALNIIYQF